MNGSCILNSSSNIAYQLWHAVIDIHCPDIPSLNYDYGTSDGNNCHRFEDYYRRRRSNWQLLWKEPCQSTAQLGDHIDSGRLCVSTFLTKRYSDGGFGTYTARIGSNKTVRQRMRCKDAQPWPLAISTLNSARSEGESETDKAESERIDCESSPVSLAYKQARKQQKQ
uniref:Uncharacterized protein n=1 Tax=Panagrellus redivivus TaxID=6233 RepID=A0A7E4W9V4_PANRE